MPLLLIYTCIFELLYLLLIILSPLPGLHLSRTPLSDLMPWLLRPSQLLLATLQPIMGSAEQSAWFSALLLAIVFVGLISTYIGAMTSILRLRNGETITCRWLYLLLGGALLFGLTLLLQPMLFSDEVFTYIFSGRILTTYSADPLNTVPTQFPSDPYLHWLVSGLNAPNIYGAFWLCISALLATISNTPVISLLLFKGTALCAHLINCILIWAILSKIAPARRLLGTLLYAWNPLALIELAGSGHSEGVLLSLLLLATWLYILQWARPSLRSDNPSQGVASHGPHATPVASVAGNHREFALFRVAALIIFGLAISTNFITLLIAPLYIWFDLRAVHSMTHRLWGFCWQALLMLMPAILFLLPFWRGASTFFAITSSMDIEHFVHAPVGLLAVPMRTLYNFIATRGHLPAIVQPATAADLTLRASTIFIFVLIYATLFAQVRRAPITPEGTDSSTSAQEVRSISLDVLFNSCSIAVFWFMALVSGWFWPWYILWLLWVVVLRRFDIFTTVILLLSGTALFIYTVVGFSRAPLATYQSALIFGIPLIYLGIAVSRLRLRKRMTHD